jgi:hypothetical protein
MWQKVQIAALSFLMVHTVSGEKQAPPLHHFQGQGHKRKPRVERVFHSREESWTWVSRRGALCCPRQGMDGWMDGWTDWWMDGWTRNISYISCIGTQGFGLPLSSAQQHQGMAPSLDDNEWVKAHLMGTCLNATHNTETEVDFVIGGYTGCVQMLDMGVNRPFKSYAREEFESWMLTNLSYCHPTHTRWGCILGQYSME